jgi:hypothetical protein
MGPVPVHVWSKKFSMYRAFSELPLNGSHISFLLDMFYRISFLPNMTFHTLAFSSICGTYEDFNIYDLFYICSFFNVFGVGMVSGYI